MEEDDERYVYWVEQRGRGCFLQATPIDVSSILAEKLFEPGGYRRPDLRHAGGVGRLRIRRRAAGARRRAQRWWCPATSITRSRRCSTCRSTCPTRAIPAFTKAAAEEIARILRAQPRPRLRAVHQLPADAPGVRPGLARNRLPDAAAGHRAAQRAARRVPRHAELRPVRHLLVLAGRGRAGRSVELRYHRQAAVRGAQRSGGERAHRKHPQGRRESVLRLPDPAGRHRAEAGIRTADPQQDRPRRPGPAG